MNNQPYSTMMRREDIATSRLEILEQVKWLLTESDAGKGSGVKHVALWNRQVEFIEEESAFEMPAVFVELGEVTYSELKSGRRFRCEVRLHVVCQVHDTGEEGAIDLADRVAELVYYDLPGFQRLASLTNHNHEEVVEHIEVLGFRD